MIATYLIETSSITVQNISDSTPITLWALTTSGWCPPKVSFDGIQRAGTDVAIDGPIAPRMNLLVPPFRPEEGRINVAPDDAMQHQRRGDAEVVHLMVDSRIAKRAGR